MTLPVCCVFFYLDMNAVSGRTTLKKTSLAMDSVFSTVLVTRVEAYLQNGEDNAMINLADRISQQKEARNALHQVEF